MNATHPSEPSTFDRAKPIALGLLLAVLGIAGLRLLEQLQHVLILLFLAALFASAISRPVARLERRSSSRRPGAGAPVARDHPTFRSPLRGFMPAAVICASRSSGRDSSSTMPTGMYWTAWSSPSTRNSSRP